MSLGYPTAGRSELRAKDGGNGDAEETRCDGTESPEGAPDCRHPAIKIDLIEVVHPDTVGWVSEEVEAEAKLWALRFPIWRLMVLAEDAIERDAPVLKARGVNHHRGGNQPEEKEDCLAHGFVIGARLDRLRRTPLAARASLSPDESRSLAHSRGRRYD